MDLTRTAMRLTASGAFIGLGVMGSCCVTPTMVAAGGALSGIGVNGLYDAIKDWLSKSSPGEEELAANDHLRTLVGDALKTALHQAASLLDLAEVDLQALRALAGEFPKAWETLLADVRWQQSLMDLHEPALPQLLVAAFQHENNGNFKDITLLEKTTWVSLLKMWMRNARVTLSDLGLERTSHYLHHRTGLFIIQLLKEDFAKAGKGRAYAALQLLCHGTVLAGLATLAERDPQVKVMLDNLKLTQRDWLIKLHDSLNDQDRRRTEKTWRFVLRLDSKLSAKLDTLDADVKVIRGDTQCIKDDFKELLGAFRGCLERNEIGARPELRSLLIENQRLKSELEESLRIVQANAAAGDQQARQTVADPTLENVLASLIADRDHAARDPGQDVTEKDLRIAEIAYLKGNFREVEYRLELVLNRQPSHIGAINQMGLFHKLQGRLDAAEGCYRRVVELSTEDSARAVAYGNLGNVAKMRGDLVQAEAMYLGALHINQALGRKVGIAIQLGNLGDILRRRGQFTLAKDSFLKALSIEESLGRKEGIAEQLGNLGTILFAQKKFDQAEAMYRKAIAMEECLGRKGGMAAQYSNLGVLLKARGELEPADAMYRKAFAIHEELADAHGMASDSVNLGSLCKLRGDETGANAHWTRSRDLFSQLGNQKMVMQLQEWIDQLS